MALSAEGRITLMCDNGECETEEDYDIPDLETLGGITRRELFLEFNEAADFESDKWLWVDERVDSSDIYCPGCKVEYLKQLEKEGEEALRRERKRRKR